MDVSDRICSELAAGEQLVWAGQPRQGLVLRASEAFALPFSLFFAGFAVFWVQGAASSGAPLPFVLFGVPFIWAGLYLVFGRFIVDARQRAGTFYAVTSQRVIICSGVTNRRVQSLPLKSLHDISLTEHRDGSGTIAFGPQHPMANVFGGMAGWPGSEADLGARFDLLPQARIVYEAIRRAQALASWLETPSAAAARERGVV